MLNSIGRLSGLAAACQLLTGLGRPPCDISPVVRTHGPAVGSVLRRARLWLGQGTAPVVLRTVAEGRGPRGGTAALIYHREDGRPVGLELVNPTGKGAREVRVRLEDGAAVAGRRLFRTVQLEHGADTYVYQYTELSSGPFPASQFEPGPSLLR